MSCSMRLFFFIRDASGLGRASFGICRWLWKENMKVLLLLVGLVQHSFLYALIHRERLVELQVVDSFCW